MEIIRHTWERHVDFIENFEALHVETFIAQFGQARYEHLQSIYNLIQTQIAEGLNIQQAIQSFDAVIRDLEEAIRLEDDTFVNP